MNGDYILDFVIPLCNYNIVIRITVESLVYHYKPRNIYIITNLDSIKLLEKCSKEWNIYNTLLNFIDEEEYFLFNYGLKKEDINMFYFYKGDKCREFGWWYQQLLKLGAYYVIKGLSDPYVLWDGDLIVLEKWSLLDNGVYKFAILQDSHKNEFNKIEYKNSTYDLLGLDVNVPEGGGTFISHHFIVFHDVIINLLLDIERRSNMSWILTIMNLTKKYYRFSEYLCLGCFMKKNNAHLLNYYKFNEYGSNGIRVRDCEMFVNELKEYIKNVEISYIEFNLFLELKNNKYSYIQLEHV